MVSDETDSKLRIASTSFWLNVWETWCKENNIVNKIEENESDKINSLLETFYAEVKNKNDDNYKPDSLRVMIAALDRHLNVKGYKFSILRDRKFHSSKQVLEGKARKLRQSGMGKTSMIFLVQFGINKHS